MMGGGIELPGRDFSCRQGPAGVFVYCCVTVEHQRVDRHRALGTAWPAGRHDTGHVFCFRQGDRVTVLSAGVRMEGTQYVDAADGGDMTFYMGSDCGGQGRDLVRRQCVGESLRGIVADQARHHRLAVLRCGEQLCGGFGFVRFRGLAVALDGRGELFQGGDIGGGKGKGSTTLAVCLRLRGVGTPMADTCGTDMGLLRRPRVRGRSAGRSGVRFGTSGMRA